MKEEGEKEVGIFQAKNKNRRKSGRGDIGKDLVWSLVPKDNSEFRVNEIKEGEAQEMELK